MFFMYLKNSGVDQWFDIYEDFIKIKKKINYECVLYFLTKTLKFYWAACSFLTTDLVLENTWKMSSLLWNLSLGSPALGIFLCSK